MKSVAIIILIFLFLIPSITAVSLSGKEINPITYIPGASIITHYTVSGTNNPIRIEVSPHPFTNITVTEVVDNQFDLMINFPENEKIDPGTYYFSLSVKEDPNSRSGNINALTAVSKMFKVIVYSYEKEVQISLKVHNINEGSNLTPQLSATSLSYSDIDSVRGQISIFDAKKNKLGEVITSEKNLPALESISFSPTFISENLPASNYSAKAVVFFDGKQKKINTSFLIGNMDVLLKDYSSNIKQGFSKFTMKVTSNWGNPLRNVYAKVFLNETEVLHTPSINLEPWEEGSLEGIIEINYPPGEYKGTIKVFFEGESKEMPIKVKVVALSEKLSDIEEESVQIPLSSILYAVAVILIIVILYLLIMKMRHPNKKNEF